MLVVLPLTEAFLNAMPIHMTDMKWRFGFAGIVSSSILLPFAGFVMAFALSLAFEQPRLQRTISLVSFAICGILVAAALLFVLDAVQLRLQVRPQAQTAFYNASLLALIRYFAAIVGSAVLAVAAWRSSRHGLESRRSTDARIAFAQWVSPRVREAGDASAAEDENITSPGAKSGRVE